LKTRRRNPYRNSHCVTAEQHSRNSEFVYIHETVHCNKFLFNKQPDASIIQIYSVIKLYMFRASSLPIIRSFLLNIRHW